MHFRTDRRNELDATCAAHVMQRQLVTVHAGDPIREVERVLADAEVSGAPVLDDNDHVIGVITTKDLVHLHAEQEGEPAEATFGEDGDGDEVDETEIVAFERPAAEACAGDVMSAEVAAVPPSASLREISRIMVEKRVHRLLVVDHDRLLGLVSTMDVLRAVALPVPPAAGGMGR